ncbi:pyridoxal phosphate-dependent aminotransferase [Falsochrobactrum sp. TDYN1]|uniref:Pyridoxal phosphate-dependent aminotransferase n=1 Tax=Falsochrobactrum tianjinense TaxID=2706015 RepID=A0A949UU53_9HYPH|nr:pyridoxal phosphate-dependent aminotransferase [Falsochrobactrum sp. TDYN1]MBV2143026.1 pyridoxal phosphate-dependent aminotransferase [Falsochrobactrum sp. TDYN1]
MNIHPSFPIEARPQVQALSSSLIREVANSAMGQSHVLPFWFGESDRPTPGFICEEAVRSLQSGETFYSQNLGRHYFREAIAEYLGNLHERPIDIERVAAIGSGVSGLMIASQLLLSPNDKVVAITPLWPNVCEIPRILGARVERVALDVAQGRWSLDLDKLFAALTPDTRALFINSPNNPTGWTIDEESIVAILAHCRKHGIWVFCDDVYERLVYDPAQRSAPSFQRYYEEGDRIISVNSFSKAWSMTGWRAGWILGPKALGDDLAKLIEYNFSCIFEPTQRAATIALKQGETEVMNMRQQLVRTRAVLQSALKGFDGVEVPDAGGAMYVFFRVSGFTDTLALAKQLLSEVGLGLAPGGAFGPEGNGWLRWCHAVQEDKLLDGIDRFSSFLSEHR